MWKKFAAAINGGAMIEYAIFLCALAVLLVTSVAYLGTQFRPQIAEWHQGAGVDKTLVGSIHKEEKSDGDKKTYRIYQLPAGLRQEK